MKKRKRTKIVLLAVLILFVALQFWPVDRSIPPFEPGQDLIDSTNPNDEITMILKNACYDCHSYQTEYPWYAYIWPVSGWVQGHVDHGRSKLNFSIFGLELVSKANHKLDEASEMVLNGDMPLRSYVRGHPKAKLTDEQRLHLSDWFIRLKK